MNPQHSDKGRLLLICGLPGAGKTTLASELESQLGAVRLCPDEWIYALLGNRADRPEADALRDHVEQLQFHLARRLLLLGNTVILENGFWSTAERERYRDAALSQRAAVELHYLEAPLHTLWERLHRRNNTLQPGHFTITLDELQEWYSLFEPPTPHKLGTYTRYQVYSS